MDSREKAEELIRRVYDISDDTALGSDLRGYRDRLITLIEEVNAEQRQMCADAAWSELMGEVDSVYCSRVEKACLNAVEKK